MSFNPDAVAAEAIETVIVPRARLAETAAALAKVREAEAALLARVQAGLTDLGPAVGAK